MTEKEAICVVKNEKSCVERNIKHVCDMDCGKCDLLMKDDDVLNGYDMAIKALEEVQQYRAIGTVEECRAAVEKQRSKKPIKVDSGVRDYDFDYKCPNCEEYVDENEHNCDCGQKLDWSGM